MTFEEMTPEQAVQVKDVTKNVNQCVARGNPSGGAGQEVR